MTKGQEQTLRARRARTNAKLERWAQELLRHGWLVQAPQHTEGGK